MAGVIIFLDKSMIPDNTTEIHFFEDDVELIRFSTAHLDRKHLVRAVNGECWHRTPGPATKAMLEWAKTAISGMGWDDRQVLQAFIAEWPNPATPPAPKPSPWRCRICGEPVRLGDDLKLRHVDSSIDHEAEMTDADLKQLNDGLGLST